MLTEVILLIKFQIKYLKMTKVLGRLVYNFWKLIYINRLTGNLFGFHFFAVIVVFNQIFFQMETIKLTTLIRNIY